MKAVEHNHTAPPEELMAYLDGELEPERALVVHAHLANCGSCAALAAELRQASSDMALWEVPALDQVLRVPPSPVRASDRRSLLAWLRVHPANAWQLAGAAVMVVVCAGLWVTLGGGRYARSATAGIPSEPGVATKDKGLAQLRSTMAGRPLSAAEGTDSRERTFGATTMEQPVSVAATGTQKIIRTVSMNIVANNFETVRETIDGLLRDVGGFVGGIQASDVSNGRSLRATLRVPAARLDETVRSLRSLGHVADESQSGEDVTEQVRDIEARLKNSRNTEQRLADVLRNRTGRVADILEVEREMARVREEIERMDAQRLNLERRVEYSTVTVQVTERRQATLDLGPMPIRTQLGNAFVDGVKAAYETLVAALVWFLNVAPVAVLWAALWWWPARIVFRTVRARTT
jgi:predicted anti-sigma-YlaC factor YlaD